MPARSRGHHVCEIQQLTTVVPTEFFRSDRRVAMPVYRGTSHYCPTNFDACRQDSKRRPPSWSCLATPNKPTTHHRTSDRRRLDALSGSAAPCNLTISDRDTLPAHVAHAIVLEICLGNIVVPFQEDDDASPADDESTPAKQCDMTSLASKTSLNSPANQSIAGSLLSRVDIKPLRFEPPAVASSSSNTPSHPYPYPHYF